MTSISSSGDDLRAREAQARSVRSVFEDAGYDPVTTPVLQPAEIFLDRHGEDIRRRTYLFADPDGRELCLRPDLTIPVCRLYLEREPAGKTVARLCSSGAVYRYQPAGSAKLSEYNQCGIELLGPEADAEADAEVTRLGIAAVTGAGLKDFELEFGDLALFRELVDALAIPEAWKGRLKRQFWRPAFFADLLTGLSNGNETSTDAKDGAAGGLLSVLAGLDETQATGVLKDVLKLGGIAEVGGRGIDEIASRLLEKASDATTERMPEEAAGFVARYMAISEPASKAVPKIRSLMKEGRVDISGVLDRLEKRLAALAGAGVDLDAAIFSTGFGRRLEYYTGHVFEVRVPSLGAEKVIVGGGRYDGLLQTLGAQKPVQAVGCAVALERLCLATGGGEVK